MLGEDLPALLPSSFSTTSLSFAMCRLHACMKNRQWFLRVFFFVFTCVNKKESLDLDALFGTYGQRIKIAVNPRLTQGTSWWLLPGRKGRCQRTFTLEIPPKAGSWRSNSST